MLEETRKLDVCDMEEFGRLESSEKTIAILGDRWWPQTAKQDGDGISKQFLCNIWKKRNERQNVGGVSIRSRNGAPSRKGCVVNGQMTINTSQGKQQMGTPPPKKKYNGQKSVKRVAGVIARLANVTIDRCEFR